GGMLPGLGWVVDGQVHSLPALYVGAVLAGLGAGMVYGTCVPNAVKWFARRRGLAAGLTVAGFGAGAALTVWPLFTMVQRSGPFQTFTFFGLVQGGVIILCGLFLVRPPERVAAAEERTVRCLQGRRDMTLGEALRSPVFWVMYATFTLVAAGGLMSVAQLGPIAKAFRVADLPIRVWFWTAPALRLALQLNNIVGGISRPLLGWISDSVGREKTLAVAFVVDAIGIWAFSRFGHTPVSFVLLVALVFFAWGELYSIFPSLMRDHFGQRYAATNYGVLYPAKGVASSYVTISAMITAATGSWTAALYLCVAMNLIPAFLVIGVLRPLRLREI